MTVADDLGRAAEDFEYYAARFLKIKDKGGQIVPFVLNSAQKIAHAAVEDMLKRKGRVRLLCVKARQQGLSTYFQARQRWRVKHSKRALKAYTISHEQKSTNNMLEMQRLFQSREPDWARPKLIAANSNEVVIAANRARIEVVTAGTQDVGRSGTAQILHASEAAYWADPKNTWAALGQVLPMLDDTEAYVESTGNGPNDFAHRVQQAQRGLSDYEVLFIPWTEQLEYRMPVKDDWKATDEEQELIDTYGVTPEQLEWRRVKIATDFPDDPDRFSREYPITLTEAFSAPNKKSFIPAALVVRCQKATHHGMGRLLVGADPGTGDTDGGDPFGVVVRHGRRVLAAKEYHGKNTMQMAGMLAKMIIAHRDSPNGIRVFVDVNGLGAGVYDRLVELGFGEWVEPVMPGESALDERKYANRKAEMADALLQDMKLGMQLPADPLVLAEMTATGRDEDSGGRLRLQAKKAVVKEYGKSPNVFDALTFTYASPTNIGRLQQAKSVDDGSYSGEDMWEEARVR